MNRVQINPPFSFRIRIPFHALIGLGLLLGCRDRVGGSVNMDVAQMALMSAMDGWKSGKSPNDLLAGSPSIFVQETEWNDGTTLLDYEILSDDRPAGPNLIATVKLKLGKADGNVAEKTATYVVGTSPSLTVYRNLMK